MQRRSFLTAIFVLLAGALTPAISGHAATDPTALVSNLGSRALEVLGTRTSESQRLARFRELLREDFDVPGIARFVLGRYWNVATEDQRAEFVKLFGEYVARAYSIRLAEYAGEKFKVTGSRLDGDGAIVSSQILRPAGQAPIKVDWRLTGRHGDYKISDVAVDGISMAVTQRSEFASVIQHHGGQIEGLIAMLREKAAASASH